MSSQYGLGADSRVALGIKALEWLKAELAASAASCLRAMVTSDDEVLLDALVNTVLCCYLLGRRAGLDLGAMDSRLRQRIQDNIKQGHELEKWHGDFTALTEHLKKQTR